jgi:uncharacterized damage-inducible protein DinB
MNIKNIATLFAYNYWATDKILSAAAQIPLAQFTALVVPDPGHGSLRGTLVHMLDGERGWRCVVEEREAVPDLVETDFADVAAVHALWQEERAIMQHHLDTLTEARLNSTVKFLNYQHEPRERIRWHVLLHVANHGTHHRSEAAAMLTGYGHSPGELDFTLFLHDHLK